jgi:hypothetical protein
MMLKFRSTLIIMISLASLASASSSAPLDRERTAGETCAQQSYELLSQDKVNNDFQSGCTRILGNLTIQSGSDITQLDALSNIQSVGGSLLINALPNLTSLQGLQSLATVGGSVSVLNNQSLSNTSGLSGLTEIEGDLLIQSNGSMSTLSGLSALVSVGGALTVSQNVNLANLDGFAALKSVGSHLTIADNDRFGFNIEGLAAVESLGGDLVITGNDYLSDVDGLEAITVVGGDLTIRDNLRLGNVDGLTSLDVITGLLAVTSNQALSDCLALAPVLGFPNQADDNVGGTISVATNAAGCNSVNGIFSSVVSPGQPTITNIKPGDGEVTLSLSVIEAGSFPVTGYRAVCTDGVNDFMAVSGELSPSEECGISLTSSDRFSVTQELGACSFSGRSTNQGLENTTAQAVFNVVGTIYGRNEVSSEANYDYGRFIVGASLVWSISGNQVRYINDFFEGQETVRFEYDKDEYVSSLDDTFTFEITGALIEQLYSPGSVKVGGLQNGTSYTCTASAISRGGESEVSQESIPVTPVERPQVDPAVLFFILNSGSSVDSDDDGLSDLEDECPEVPGDAPTGCPALIRFEDARYWDFWDSNNASFSTISGEGCYVPGDSSAWVNYRSTNMGIDGSRAFADIRVRNGGSMVVDTDSAYGDVATVSVNGNGRYRADGPFYDYAAGVYRNQQTIQLADGDDVRVEYVKNRTGSSGFDQVSLAFYGVTVCGLLNSGSGGGTATSTTSTASSGGRNEEDAQEATEEPTFGP